MSKVYLVTGAASGIGQALARQLLSGGHIVVACDVNMDGLHTLATDATVSRLTLHSLDVRQPEAWQAVVADTVARWGRIDTLCNVAGVLKENWCDAATAAEVDFHMDINVKGVVFGVQAVVPHMKKVGKGHIVNIASLAALSPVPGLSLYSASKFAVRAYSLAISMELKAHGISVSTICPDAVQTPMLDIQMGKDETALTFSGSRALTAQEVVDAIVDSERTQVMEVMLPYTRGLTAKLANLAPALSAKAIGLFKAAGKKRQAAIQGGKDSTRA